jgi:hypothetical protein
VCLQDLIKSIFSEKYENDTCGWNFVKFHWILTFPISRILMGSLRGLSCQAVELAHRPYSKAIQDTTNLKGNVTVQITSTWRFVASCSEF